MSNVHMIIVTGLQLGGDWACWNFHEGWGPDNPNTRISRKSQNFTELEPSTQPHSQNENFVNTSKKLFKYRNWTFSMVRYFTWKLEFVSNILSMIVVICWFKKI